ncbi:unnamed protein product [Paramecium pentaurelia]|uniref:Uncharacterized protein n=1 Tax=Paramecium pentaurelia TaxID=43138 RepID=A0A8S1XVU8_9CILI|nr:unnamed protein product [Paramecium pentaurelia]
MDIESASSDYHDKKKKKGGKNTQIRINQPMTFCVERPRRGKPNTGFKEESSEEEVEPQQESSQEQEESVFDPDIDQILWRREKEDGEIEFYVKYKSYSYLWCEWKSEQQIISKDKNGKQKINRFTRQFEKKIKEYDPDELLEMNYFDPSYLEIDRLISSTELFPIIHPKKANEIKGKWNEYLSIIISKLLNYSEGRVKFGVYFMQPVNPETDGCPDYRKIITQPMDLGTIYNRLYLEYYRNSQQFWYELGLVFKNCRKYNSNPEGEIRKLGDALGECALILYYQWYEYTNQKYQLLLKLKKCEEDEEYKQQIISEIGKEKLEEEINQEKIQLLGDIELWNPGQQNYQWFEDDTNFQPKLTIERQVDLFQNHEQLYLVKWKNLSYLQATWEFITGFPNSQAKLFEFRTFTRSLDKDSRQLQIQNCRRHKQVLDYDQKKKNRISQQEILDLKTQLYQLDIGKNKKPYQYTPRTQTIYKDRKLLRDYQLESLNWMIDAYYNNRNVLLADEMGLGKTIQSIAFLNHLVSMESCRGPFLIIAPLSTLQHWKRSCEDWTSLNAVLYYDQQGQPGRQAIRDYEWFYTDISLKGNTLPSQELYKFQILITSFEVFNQDHSTYIQQIPFQFIIVDEAHRLKNQNAKILASLKRLVCSRIMILTGTPVQNNPEELWSLLNFIEPYQFPSLNQFKSQFGDLNTAEQIEKLNKTLKPYILRRQKEDVEQSIPPLQENIIDVELTNVQKTLYRALYERNKSALIQGFSQQTAQIASLNNLDMHLRKLCNHPLLLKEMHSDILEKSKGNEGEYQKILIEYSGKMVLLDKMLKKFLKEDKKMLIFSQFTNMLALLEEYLQFNQIKYEKITGDIKQIDRQNAIDRFNDQKKGRQVFLLSTKAGGQGINLTAAEIVVIFDSDWNPQNDIQATARAHRIGQDKQVTVYRFITKNTYEAKMFERAFAKLGLDQAIFMNGEFKSANLNQANSVVNPNPDQNNRKLSKKELEILLKQGSLGLLEHFGQESIDQNIDDILNNTRVAKYSLINGAYTISKQTYVPDQANQQIDIDDPNFWQKVLKNQESKSQKILKKLQDDLNIKTFQQQKEIMLESSECVNNIIQSKLSREGYDADEENTILDILNLIEFSKFFEKDFKNLANSWIIELSKPSRRFKKITESDLMINTAPISQQIIETPKPQKNFELNWSEYEEYKKLQSKSSQDLQIRLCAICEKQKCDMFCRGFCRRQFHKECLEGGQYNGQTQGEINIKYLCQDCEKYKGTCFVCLKQGTFYPNLSKKKTQQDKQFIDDDGYYDNQGEQIIVTTGKITRARAQQQLQQQLSELVKCSLNCHKLYHFACVQTSKNFKILDGERQKFKCALHFCEKCKDKSNDDNQKMIQCLRCPKSYHEKCAPKGIRKVTKKFVICPAHKEELIQPIIKKKVKIEPTQSTQLTRKLKKINNGSDVEQ